MSWIDLSIIFIFMFSVLSGYRRGLIVTLASLISFFLSLFLANKFYKELANYILLNTQFAKQIKSIFVSTALKNNNLVQTNSWANGTDLTNLPNGAKGYIDQILINGSSVNGAGDINDIVIKLIINIISFLLIFFLVGFGLRLLAQALNVLSKLPVLNFINKIGGAFIGVLQGAIFNLIIVSIIYTIAIFGSHQSLVNEINNSIIAQYFYIGYVFY